MRCPFCSCPLCPVPALCSHPSALLLVCVVCAVSLSLACVRGNELGLGVEQGVNSLT